jgi:transcription initiation factor TFIID subunit 2
MAFSDCLHSSFVFRDPVDPVLLQIPTYFDVIPRKNARDLRTIRSKLDADKYDSFDAWEADMDLMIDNALLFNGADSEVGIIAVQFQEKYKDMLSAVKGGASGKRKGGGDKATSQPVKKARLG